MCGSSAASSAHRFAQLRPDDGIRPAATSAPPGVVRRTVPRRGSGAGVSIGLLVRAAHAERDRRQAPAPRVGRELDELRVRPGRGEPEPRQLAIPADEVVRRRRHHVPAGAAARPAGVEGVVAATAGEPVPPPAAEQAVVAVPAADRVVARGSVEIVVARAAVHAIRAVSSDDEIVGAEPAEVVVSGTAFELVGSPVAAQLVRAGSSDGAADGAQHVALSRLTARARAGDVHAHGPGAPGVAHDRIALASVEDVAIRCAARVAVEQRVLIPAPEEGVAPAAAVELAPDAARGLEVIVARTAVGRQPWTAALHDVIEIADTDVGPDQAVPRRGSRRCCTGRGARPASGSRARARSSPPGR